MSGSYGPRLVIAGGPRSGERYPLRLGDQVIGRADTADVILGAGDVSREHAHIWWDGATATIADAGSSHGTEVNGYRIVGSHALRPGDLLRLGSAELLFETQDVEHTTGPMRPVASEGASAGGVGNRVGRDNYGEIVQAGRDLRYDVDYHTRLELDDPMDELFKGRGVGRFLVAIGLLIAFAGFAGWAYLIFSGFTEPDPGQVPNPFALEVFGVPAAMVAFGSFAVGGIIASIGKGMSKAARERADRKLEMWRVRGLMVR
jgi:Inner membrane component of T3SS, cytoplasmic domain